MGLLSDDWKFFFPVDSACLLAATAVDLLGTEFPTGEAVGRGVLLASLDRADYLPPPAAATAPTDVSAHMSIGPPENAG